MKPDNKMNTPESATQLKKWNMINSHESPCVLLACDLCCPPAYSAIFCATTFLDFL